MPLASLPVTDLSGRLETKNMHVCIYSQCTNAFIYACHLRKRMEAMQIKGWAFWRTKKNPHS
ncbi:MULTISPECIES: hypothetical protein, partial [unclassified Pseudomonas]|uniref:hypothetical protein n=1 Tax=unclassified Pseudomonas TaxID=196821 RepID=UPI00200D35EA